jgi:predicted dithiol-disulfide oxidoreductase (DUF899 family)
LRDDPPALALRGIAMARLGDLVRARALVPGVSAFWKDDAGKAFHTYSTYGRGVEVMMHTHRLLDLTPKGRDEDGRGFTMEWVRHHDRYEPAPAAKAAKAAGSCCGR